MKKAAWYRLYTSVLDPFDKTRALSDRLYRQWTYVLAAYRKNEGTMPGLKVLATCLGLGPAATLAVLDDLRKASLLDCRGDIWTPHDWDDLQFESDISTERVREYRRRRQDRELPTRPQMKRRLKQLGTVSRNVSNPSGTASRNVSNVTIPAHPSRNAAETPGETLVETLAETFPPYVRNRDSEIQSSELSDDEELPGSSAPPSSSSSGNGNRAKPDNTPDWAEGHWAKIADWLIAIRKAAGNLQSAPPRIPDREICLDIGACFESLAEFVEWAREKAKAKEGGSATSWAWYRKLARLQGSRGEPVEGAEYELEAS